MSHFRSLSFQYFLSNFSERDLMCYKKLCFLVSGWCGGSFQHPSPGRRDNGTPGIQCPSGVGDVSASNRYHPNGATPETFGQSKLI